MTSRQRAIIRAIARDALLRVANDLLESEGAAGLSLRQLAKRAGLSRQAPYNHFANKEALLAEVAADGFRELAKRMASGLQEDGPFERLAAAADGYIGFGTEHPALFRLMFGRELVDLRQFPEAQTAANDAFAVLSDAILSIGASSKFEEMRLVAWSLVHGYSGLCLEVGLEQPDKRKSRAELFARTVLAIGT